jgi:hypothetical protein
MGVGKKYSLHEIDETKGVAADEAFEDIIQRVKDAGGKIEKDENTPLYTEIGMDEAEVGSKRVVEFNLNRFDFQLIREVKTMRIMGEGRTKSLEKMGRPQVHMIMKRKSEIEDTWKIVDLEDMF